ncbi:ABC transporter ATP-binding protein [Labrenzia sp. PHM005]|uniref:ABC transporter ATP-binding protein n=1 Tax=Labrenzia sp. PHM005 TaxID=2590016 RepID=UPI0011404AEC|nr:ABC transporter ATP-binding protein [Labrenzia sp. PHM005]QDG77275.1 ABC transporter ATP-binding protein [Labrenzia sp. PHM005]
MSGISLENVSKKYGNFTAVNSVSLEIQNAEFVAILGPSGCGKTTTMNMIAGLEDITSGTIRFDNRDVTNLKVQQRGVGFVFQNYAIFTHMSVRDNLAFGLRIKNLSQADIDRKVGEMAEFMALSHRLEEKSSSLSVNELQKLAIGRSAIVEPSIFLLDEPLSNLDAAFRERMRSDLRELQRELKQTMVYVTHDQIEAMGLADKIAVMNQAHLQQFATPEEIYARPANVFVARFIGAPSMNIVSGTLHQMGDNLELHIGGRAADSLRLPLPLANAAKVLGYQGLLFGFRPETLSVSNTPGPDCIAADVALVETVGRRRIVHFQSGGTKFLGVFDRSFSLRSGDATYVRFDLSRCHLFDPETELRLKPCDAPSMTVEKERAYG